MLRDLWRRLTGSRTDAERSGGWSPEERRLAEEPVEESQADEFAESHLGGFDPDRLLPGGEPPPQDAPPRD